MASISGRVSLSPALAARVAPGDTVFIFARAAEGPRMPLAILKRTAADLPASFIEYATPPVDGPDAMPGEWGS